MEIRGNVKQIGDNTEITVKNDRITPHQKKPAVRVVEQPKTKAEVAKGFLAELGKGFQGFADWAATTRAGSQDLDDVFGLPDTERRTKKRRK